MDGSVRIEGVDRTGFERLLRYCARPPFALEHLHQRDAGHLVYRNPKPARTTAPGTRPAALVLTPLELITKIAALVPPPRAHRHRYYGVLAPNAPLRSVVTALAPAAVPPAPTSAAPREEPHAPTSEPSGAGYRELAQPDAAQRAGPVPELGCIGPSNTVAAGHDLPFRKPAR